MSNSINQELGRQAEEGPSNENIGEIANMARRYDLESIRLLGLLLKLDFQESHFVTCDPWKRNCGGVPRGSFVLFRIDPRAIDPEDRAFSDRLILARITNAAPTPVEANIQQTLFQVHKMNVMVDPLTHRELQWGGLKASIVGTFYDIRKDDGQFQIGFGNDVDSFFAPFAYVAYVPTNEDLITLINSFVQCDNPFEIGVLRYTETPSPASELNVPIQIDPRDIVGESAAAQRLANFGKTRYGKSNSNKIISRAIFESNIDVAQVFFDPSGEYTYINDQDGTSLYALYHNQAVRYSLSPRELRDDEANQGLEPARHLSINFYQFPDVGHSLIVSLWSTENSTMPGYMRPILDWAPGSLEQIPDRNQDRSGFSHYWRTMGMWFALLHRAGFVPPENLAIPINFKRSVKEKLVENVTGIRLDNSGRFNQNGQPITVLLQIYREIKTLFQQHGAHRDWFPPSGDGSPYFNDIEDKLLKSLTEPNLVAHNYIRPFNRYHSSTGISVFHEISQHVEEGTSVFIDMAQSNEKVRNNLVDRICRSIFNSQNRRFNSEAGIGDRFVIFYFEEAHRLFSKDDSDLNSIYNLLAKEGAKLNIAMVYSTQSMTTISPDLLKNTDNFLIAHLDDDREAREVARKFAFRDVADDVQRIQSKGFVRMITKSHRFALPVQINLFRA